eukprot:1187647-Prorocentrum_minimum.AAC.1
MGFRHAKAVTARRTRSSQINGELGPRGKAYGSPGTLRRRPRPRVGETRPLQQRLHRTVVEYRLRCHPHPRVGETRPLQQRLHRTVEEYHLRRHRPHLTTEETCPHRRPRRTVGGALRRRPRPMVQLAGRRAAHPAGQQTGRTRQGGLEGRDEDLVAARLAVARLA